MHNPKLHCERKHFYRYCLQAFSLEKILKFHVNDYFKINGKEMIKMTKNSDYLESKSYGRKIKLPFMAYAVFESILVPEDNGKRNPEESCNTNIKKHDAYSHGCKLMYVSIINLVNLLCLT